jgi:hypothetical protein
LSIWRAAVTASKTTNERDATRRRSPLEPGRVPVENRSARARLERRAVDATFRALDVYYLGDYSRPLIRVGDFLAFVERSRYDESRVR